MATRNVYLEVFICVWGRRRWEVGSKHIEKTDILNTPSKETFYHMTGGWGGGLGVCAAYFGFLLRTVFFYDAYSEAHVSI